MLTLALIAAVAAFAIPTYFESGGVTLENAAVLLARDLRAAQNRSAYLAEPSRFVFPEEGEGYYVTDLRDEIVKNPRTNQLFRRRYPEDGVFRGVHVEEVQLGPERSLVYDERGFASEGGFVVLAFRGRTLTIRIDKGSGVITIPSLESEWQDHGY